MNKQRTVDSKVLAILRESLIVKVVVSKNLNFCAGYQILFCTPREYQKVIHIY